MSLVSQGRGVSCGALGSMGVVGSRCLGSPGPALRVSGPFSFTAPSLMFRPPFPATAPIPSGGWLCQMRCPSWWRRPSRSCLLHLGFTVASLLPLKSPGLATSHRPFTPQRLDRALQFSYGDCSVRSPVSPEGLDSMLGPPGSGSFSLSPLPEVLRGGCCVSVSGPVLRPLLAPCIVNYASPRFSSSSLHG